MPFQGETVRDKLGRYKYRRNPCFNGMPFQGIKGRAPSWSSYAVAILVLMECPFRDNFGGEDYQNSVSRNPCFNGMPFQGV